ncbi:MAG: GIY-YIG nuclease family protein [Candidatus Levybacteria bacterium]|nr:GIY-YIG nuclease family protein [Candidatus Levybacteria bacterium]
MKVWRGGVWRSQIPLRGKVGNAILLCRTEQYDMFYIYVLKSLKNGDIYVGFSDNLRERYKAHNNKRVKSTKVNVPWELVYYEAYKDKKDATKREKQLKEHKVKIDLKEQLKYSLVASNGVE